MSHDILNKIKLNRML